VQLNINTKLNYQGILATWNNSGDYFLFRKILFGTVNSLRSLTSSAVALPKAFQKQTSFAFGFFNAHPLNQASLFRGFALKKPITL